MSSIKYDPIEFLIKHSISIRDDEIPADVLNKSRELVRINCENHQIQECMCDIHEADAAKSILFMPSSIKY